MDHVFVKLDSGRVVMMNQAGEILDEDLSGGHGAMTFLEKNEALRKHAEIVNTVEDATAWNAAVELHNDPDAPLILHKLREDSEFDEEERARLQGNPYHFSQKFREEKERIGSPHAQAEKARKAIINRKKVELLQREIQDRAKKGWSSVDQERQLAELMAFGDDDND